MFIETLASCHVSPTIFMRPRVSKLSSILNARVEQVKDDFDGEEEEPTSSIRNADEKDEHNDDEGEEPKPKKSKKPTKKRADDKIEVY